MPTYTLLDGWCTPLSVFSFSRQENEKEKDSQSWRMHKRNTEARLCNHFCHAKAISITYSECVPVALCIQHVKCTRRIISASIVCLVPHIFPHYLISGTTLEEGDGGNGEEVIEHKMCVLTFSTTFIQNISHSTKDSARYNHKRTYVFM